MAMLKIIVKKCTWLSSTFFKLENLLELLQPFFCQFITHCMLLLQTYTFLVIFRVNFIFIVIITKRHKNKKMKHFTLLRSQCCRDCPKRRGCISKVRKELSSKSPNSLKGSKSNSSSVPERPLYFSEAHPLFSSLFFSLPPSSFCSLSLSPSRKKFSWLAV